jgi:ectoine hydroxylase-related dioxygenase (phytanoyl-CoA dioxygenase family)
MQQPDAEMTTAPLTEGALQQALDTLHEQGFVILPEVLPEAWVTATRAAFNAELQTGYRDRPTSQSGHGGFEPPLQAPFLDPQIIENAAVLQVLERALGEHFFGCLPYGCNTAFPGSGVQNVHRDCGHLFPELGQALPPMLIVVNFLLDDFTAANGATEIWPGSHRQVDADQAEISTLKISPSRWSEHPRVQATTPAGSIVIRDMRTWHRGMANTTDESRTMLSLVYYRQYALPDNLHASEASLGDVEWERLSDRAKWVYRLRREH